MKLSHEEYSALYGPTTGDRVRLADTDLIIEVEKDLGSYGEEAVFGGGKSIRVQMGQDGARTRDEGVLDSVIVNALIVDYTGIYKADIGLKDGHIHKIGKAGNPDTMEGVTEGMVIGASTEVYAGENMIATAGGVDTHIHYISPDQVQAGLHGGITTQFGGGTGPAAGSTATTISPGPWNIQRMLQQFEDFPINMGVFGKGHASNTAPLVEQIKAGAAGFKIHEDWGSTPTAIDNTLKAADEYDVQVALHSDTLNEAGFVDNTLDAIAGRVMHFFHTEGAGGGHAPDQLKVTGYENVLPASTNPSKPYTVNTIDEHLDMLMVVHHLNPNIPEDVAFADSRIRPETIMAEDILQDRGILSMMSSDSQAMGRIGEVWSRTFQTADKMKKQFGELEEDKGNGNDNYRVKRYISKITINPAIASGVAEDIGSIEEGKLADIILWNPAFFGIRPQVIIKGGLAVWSQSGDANATTTTSQPVWGRTQYAYHGKGPQVSSITFMSQAAIDAGVPEELGLEKMIRPVKNCRNISKKDMKFNDATPDVQVNPETYEVTVDGELLQSEPASELPLGQRYMLF